MNVPFASFQQMHREVEKELDSAIKEVIQRNWFIRGTQNEQFEKKFAKYCGTAYCVGCGNGLDALTLLLKAYGIKEGDHRQNQSHNSSTLVWANCRYGYG